MTNPSLLMLDEPTSGLDSSTAHSVLETLSNLARTGRTVITTIHQPSSRMYSKFDKLLLLARGKTIYYGPANKAIEYFALQGHVAPVHYNPADFLLELVTDEELSAGVPKIEHLANSFQEFSEKMNVYERGVPSGLTYSQLPGTEEPQQNTPRTPVLYSSLFLPGPPSCPFHPLLFPVICARKMCLVFGS